MSLRALPLMVIPLILYNLLVMFSGGEATQFFASPLFKLPMIKGAEWVFTRGDLIILLTAVPVRRAHQVDLHDSASSLVDHGLSMVVFIACIVEFLLANAAATSTFFFCWSAAIDVVAGFTIGIRVARRDLAIGGVD